MLKKIILGIAVLIVGVMVYAALKPGKMYVARETVIHAPADRIFPYINNSKKTNDWMPWKDSDPGVQMNYSGPEEGVGAKSSWDSSGQMGTGEALVVESIPNQSVKTQLTYTKPFQMSQMAEMALSPAENGGTKVRWSVDGHNGFFFRLIGVFMDCDKMVGGEFEKGLAKLKTQVESSGK